MKIPNRSLRAEEYHNGTEKYNRFNSSVDEEEKEFCKLEDKAVKLN